MRLRLPILAALASCASVPPVSSQEAEPFPGANAVAVDPAGDGAPLESVASALAINGWAVEKQGASSVTTDWRTLAGVEVRLLLAPDPADPDLVLVRGDYRELGRSEPVAYYPDRGPGANRLWWDFVDSAAQLGDPVRFERR